jgi:hypothetical protein
MEYSAGPLQRLRLGNGTYIRIKGLPSPFIIIITIPPKRGIQMTEEMRYLSRVKGEERQLFRHTVREKQAYDTVLAPFVPTQRTSIDIQGEGPGTGEPLSDAQVVSILVVIALFRAPLVVVPRRRELVVNTKWLG